MMHHPLLLVPKLVVLAIIIVILIILHGCLSPADFRVAVVIALALFLCSAIAIWIVGVKVLNNPKSRIGRATILSQQEHSQDGFRASSDEFASLVGVRGVALSPLRPAGIALVEGKRISVVTEGGFIRSNTPIEVVGVASSRVVVRIVPDNTTDSQKKNSS